MTHQRTQATPVSVARRAGLVAAALIASALILPASASAQVAVTNNKIKYDGHAYRRDNAHRVHMFTICKKRNVLGKTPYCEPGDGPGNDFSSAAGKVTVLSINEVKSSNLAGTVKAAGLSLGATRDGLRSGRLRVAVIAIDSYAQLTRDINHHPGYRRRMLGMPQKDLRVVTAVLIVIKQSEAQTWQTNGQATYNAGTWYIAASAGAGKSVSFHASKGTVIGYDMAKAKWSGTFTRKAPLRSLSLDVLGI